MGVSEPKRQEVQLQTPQKAAQAQQQRKIYEIRGIVNMVTPVKQDRHVAGRRPSLQNVGMNILGPSPVGNRNKASELKASPPLAKLDEIKMTDRPKSRSSSRGSSRSSGKK